MVTILISAAFRGATLISMWIPKGAALIRGNMVDEFDKSLNHHCSLIVTETNVH